VTAISSQSLHKLTISLSFGSVKCIRACIAALSSVIGKIFDRIVLNKYCDELTTLVYLYNLEFWIEEKSFHCHVYVVLTTDCYNSIEIIMSCSMVDATKAFD